MSGRIDEVNRRIMGDSLLVVEVLGEPDAFLAIVAAERPRRPDRARRTAPTSSGSAATPLTPASCWRSLVGQGVRVASFVRRKDNLEDLFLKVGSKELS